MKAASTSTTWRAALDTGNEWRYSGDAGAWSAVHSGLGTSCYQAIWAGDQVVALAVAHDANPDGNPDTRDIARLVAAAPQLLEALSDLVEHHIAEITAEYPDYEEGVYVRFAREVIAKATGSTS